MDLLEVHMFDFLLQNLVYVFKIRAIRYVIILGWMKIAHGQSKNIRIHRKD